MKRVKGENKGFLIENIGRWRRKKDEEKEKEEVNKSKNKCEK